MSEQFTDFGQQQPKIAEAAHALGQIALPESPFLGVPDQDTILASYQQPDAQGQLHRLPNGEVLWLMPEADPVIAETMAYAAKKPMDKALKLEARANELPSVGMDYVDDPLGGSYPSNYEEVARYHKLQKKAQDQRRLARGIAHSIQMGYKQ